MMLKGIAVSAGISIGKALVITKRSLKIQKRRIKNSAQELERFKRAVSFAKEEIAKVQVLTEEKVGKNEALVFGVHLLMLEDPEFTKEVCLLIDKERINAEYAVKSALNLYIDRLGKLGNPYFKERINDIHDLGTRVISILGGVKNSSHLEITEECIIIAEDLAPSAVVQLNKEKVLGLITAAGGRTSHTAIMVRALEIPTVMGIKNVTGKIKNGDLVIIDGEEGHLMINPDQAIVEKYWVKQIQLLESQNELLQLSLALSVTRDGKKVGLTANIGSPEDVESLVRIGVEGIGLFRTEFLYMDKKSPPSESDQFEAYQKVLERMGNKPVVIRTLDIGGDKKLPYLAVEKEMNPFLGQRGLRLCLNRKELFKTQLRAILKASVYGNLKIVFPMISCLREFQEAKQILAEVKLELKKAGIFYKQEIPVGILVEVPSTAIVSDFFAKEVDFFSIGTNDLIQYTLAADRTNENISYLYDPLNPAVLRLIKTVIDNGHKEGKRVGMCGEMAGDVRFIPLLLGLGLDELSMSASAILMAKKIIRNLNFLELKGIAADVLTLNTSAEIMDYLATHIRNLK